jgi:hypothetical protein
MTKSDESVFVYFGVGLIGFLICVMCFLIYVNIVDYREITPEEYVTIKALCALDTTYNEAITDYIDSHDKVTNIQYRKVLSIVRTIHNKRIRE